MKELKEFAFYLDAWMYCVKNNISQSKIVKKNFRLWNIEDVYA